MSERVGLAACPLALTLRVLGGRTALPEPDQAVKYLPEIQSWLRGPADLVAVNVKAEVRDDVAAVCVLDGVLVTEKAPACFDSVDKGGCWGECEARGEERCHRDR